MKVALVSPEFPPDIGGVETYAYEFARELVRQGHEVTVFTVRHGAGEITLPGLTVVPGLSYAQDLDRKLFDAHPADIWHVLNAGYAWVALTGRPTLVSIHGNDFLRTYVPCAAFSFRRLPGLWRHADRLDAWLRPLWLRRNQALMRRALPAARHILSNSRYTETVFLEQFPNCRGLTSVAHVGVSARFFAVPRAPQAGRAARLLSVCRLSEPRKNIDLVLRALGRLKDEFEFEYIIAGDGYMRADLEVLRAQLGLSERVRFAGRVADDELMRLYGAADLFVLPASIVPGSHEGFGIVYLEAAASGAPSLAAHLAGAVEAIGEGVSGYFVDAPDQAGIARALREFLAGERRFDPQACRDFAAAFSWERVVGLALKHYQ